MRVMELYILEPKHFVSQISQGIANDKWIKEI